MAEEEKERMEEERRSRKEIENAIGSDLFSMQVYPSNF
jgi:hypothetical protein